MSPRKRPSDKTQVASVESMMQMDLVKHARVRHRFTMRFITRAEHAADHRLHADLLDHIHPEDRREAEEEDGGSQTA